MKHEYTLFNGANGDLFTLHWYDRGDIHYIRESPDGSGYSTMASRENVAKLLHWARRSYPVITVERWN